MKHKGIVAVSLFSGAGGLDVGSHMAGVPVVAAVEQDLDSVRTLRANPRYAPRQIYHSDITQLDAGIVAQQIKDESPGGVIVVGGPPCQPFSKNGYWVGNANRDSASDPRNLIDEFFRFVEALRPDGFLLENVESILHPTNRVAVALIHHWAERLGFAVIQVRANALDYGVPQRRKRVFFMGSRRPFDAKEPWKTHGPPDELALGGERQPYTTVGPAIAPYSGPEWYEPTESTAEGTYFRELCAVPPGKNYLVLATKSDGGGRFVTGKRFWNFLLKLSPDGQSWTIPAQPGPWVGPFHWSNRRLRVPEIAAIQSFPPGYVFCGSRRSIQRQIGNAVPPLLGKAMIAHLTANL